MPEQKDISKGKQAFLLTVGKLLALAFTFLMPVFLTRFLSVGEYGLYVQLNTVSTFLIAIFSFGIQNNLYFFYPAVEAGRKRALVFNSLLALGVGAGVVFLLCAVPVCRKFLLGSEPLETYWIYIGFYVLFSMAAELLEPFYVVSHDVRISLWFPMVQTIAKFIAVILFVFIFGGMESIFAAMVLVAALIFLFAFVYYLRNTAAAGRNPVLDFRLLKRQLLYVLPFGFSVILFTLAGQFDKILCIQYLTTEEYALYSIAFFAIPGISQIYSAVGNVYLVNMTESYLAGDSKKTLRLFHELTCKIFAFSFPLILGVCLFADVFFAILFSDKYLPAVPYFRIHVFAFCFTMLGAGLIIRASGRTRYSFYAYMYSAILTLPATYWGIRCWGIWGGISMSMVSQFCPKFLQMIFESRIMNISIRQYMPWGKFLKIMGISVGVLCPFFLGYAFVTHHLTFAVSGGVLYIVIVYGILIGLDLFIIDKKYFQEKLLYVQRKIFAR